MFLSTLQAGKALLLPFHSESFVSWALPDLPGALWSSNLGSDVWSARATCYSWRSLPALGSNEQLC